MTTDEFITKFRIDPQTYVERTAVNAALGARVPEAVMAFDDAKAAINALGDIDAINAGSDQAAIQDAATKSNFLAAKREELLAWQTAKDQLTAFAAGELEWASVHGSLGATAQVALSTGAVDADLVREAVAEALA